MILPNKDILDNALTYAISTKSETGYWLNRIHFIGPISLHFRTTKLQFLWGFFLL